MTPDSTYLSIPQATQRLRDGGLDVNAAQVRRWVRKGQLASIQLPNGRAQIHPNDLAALLPVPAAS